VQLGLFFVDAGDLVEDGQRRRGDAHQFRQQLGAVAGIVCNRAQRALGQVGKRRDGAVALQLAEVSLLQLRAEHARQAVAVGQQRFVRAAEQRQRLLRNRRRAVLLLRCQHGVQHQPLRGEAATPGQINQGAEDFSRGGLPPWSRRRVR
jgi:hypothetical protein